MRACSVGGCEKRAVKRGWCDTHYASKRRAGSFTPRSKDRRCSIEGCNSKHYGRGFCALHWKRWKDYGDPNMFQRIRGKNPEDVFRKHVKREGECLVWQYGVGQNGYGYLFVDGTSQLAHRYAWERVNGPITSGLHVDHTCWNRACVEVAHLRLATPAQNGANQSGASAANKSTGFRNVYRTRNGKYSVIVKRGARHYYGNYGDLDEAVKVAAAAREELFGAFAGRG